jgi:hypothetical protein
MVFYSLLASVTAIFLVIFIYTHTKFDFRVPGYKWWQQLLTFHFTAIWQKFLDYDLNENVGYAKHAISIDESRRDFARVKWGYKQTDLKHAHASRDDAGNLWFEQVWFAGNHSDIGGSYPENESRLSDIALHWMLSCATVIPNKLKYDPAVLQLWPYSDGMQHDEVRAGIWFEKHRELPLPENGPRISVATMHASVYARFDREAVQIYDIQAPYRPVTLRNHIDFAPYYAPGAPFPATSSQTGTCFAERPGSAPKIKYG